MQGFSENFVGTDGAPPSAQAYKRAVYKQPPRHFTVEALAPQKHGNAYSYGMRIIPVRNNEAFDRHSTISGISAVSGNSSNSSGSGSASGSQRNSVAPTATTATTTEYEVWRRWEDCLYFQDLLETQYALMAREKRTRLQAGKGVKKNGVYPHEDPHRLQRAASFDSLPPGPDPNMIAKDVHSVLPKLTKKGTLFKASKDTVQQRAAEFKALVDALWGDGADLPTLILELRQLRVVRDFFGYWRRDQDREQKERGKSIDAESIRSHAESMISTMPPSSRNSSVFGSSFGMYFSASNLSLQLPTTFSLPAEAFPADRRPRRPPIMDGGRGAMLPVSPATSEPAPSINNSNSSSSNTLQVPRQRAQTLQGTGMSSKNSLGDGSTSSGQSTRTVKTSSTGSASSQSTTPSVISRPPASAPAGVSFTFKMHTPDNDDGRTAEDGGYLSDSASLAESFASTQTYQASTVSSRPPRTPRSAPANYGQGLIRDMPLSANAKGKQRADLTEPIIVNHENTLDVPIDEGDMPYDDEDEHLMVLREHEHLMPRSLDPLPESAELEFNLGGRLQDLTIEEEDDEHEEVSTLHNLRMDESVHSEDLHANSGIISPVPRSGRDARMFEEEPIPAPRTPRRMASPPAAAAYRNGMFFSPPASVSGHGLEDEDDGASSVGGHSAMTAERSRSPLRSPPGSGFRSNTPLAMQRTLGRAEAMSALTSEQVTRLRSPSPSMNNKRLTTSTVSTQASFRSSSSSGLAPSFDSHTTLGVHMGASLRPISIQSSATISSCADIDSRFTSSPIVLHTPLYEEPDEFQLGAGDAVDGRPRLHRSHDSVSSMRSIMTNCSADAIIPRNERSVSPPPIPPSAVPPRLQPGPGANLRRSHSSGSRRPARLSQMSALSGGNNITYNEDGEELIDGYFYGVTSSPTASTLEESGTLTPGREHVRGALASPDNFPKPFQNRPAGQFHLPWTATQTSPPTSAGIRNSMLSMDSSIAPSMMSSIFDEANAIAIKAVYGDHIVAFRADRSISLGEVRNKLHHKLVNQQGVKLSNKFVLMFKPPAPERSNKTGGRARSSSVSSIGASDNSALRLIFSQGDWQDAVNSCGTRLTLHVINA